MTLSIETLVRAYERGVLLAEPALGWFGKRFNLCLTHVALTLRTANVLLPCILLSVVYTLILMGQPQILEAYRVLAQHLAYPDPIRGTAPNIISVVSFLALLGLLGGSLFVSAVVSFGAFKSVESRLKVQSSLHYPTALIATAPLFGAAFGLANAGPLSDDASMDHLLVPAALLLAVVATFAFVFLADRMRSTTQAQMKVAAIGTRVLAEALFIMLIIAVADALLAYSSSYIGVLTILLIFFNIVTILVTGLYMIGILWGLPLLTMLLGVAVLFSVAGLNDNHRIGTISTDIPSNPIKTLQENFSEWLAARPDRVRYPRGYPVFIVAAEGGGIYAAMHAGLLLSRLRDLCPAFADHLFAISAVSGGSFGASTFSAALQSSAPTPGPPAAALEEGLAPHDCEPPSPELRDQTDSSATGSGIETHVRDVLMNDFLTPVARAAFFGDALQTFLPIPIERLDRARALENSFIEAWRSSSGFETNPFEEDFRKSWSPNKSFPALVLNSTQVTTGERVVFSPFRIDGPSRLAHFPIDTEPVSLATAVTTSARFPWLTPAGWIDAEPIFGEAPAQPASGTELNSGDRNSQPANSNQSGKSVLQLVDGGYSDNSGIVTALDIIAGLKDFQAKDSRPIEIFLVIIRFNDSQPRQNLISDLLAPIDTLLAARKAQTRAVLRQVRDTFSPANTKNEAVKGAARSHVIESLLSGSAYPLPLAWQISNVTARTVAAQIENSKDCASSNLQSANRPDCALNSITDILSMQ